MDATIVAMLSIDEHENKDGELAVDGRNESTGERTGTMSAGININEKNYQQWSHKQILVWLKDNLIVNGLTQRKTKQFLKECNGKYVTGGTIHEMKNNPQIINELKEEFIVKACIRNIGEKSLSVDV